jgi:hypothetical protein
MPDVKIETDITRIFQDVIRQLRPAQGSSRVPLGRDVDQLLEDAKEETPADLARMDGWNEELLAFQADLAAGRA